MSTQTEAASDPREMIATLLVEARFAGLEPDEGEARARFFNRVISSLQSTLDRAEAAEARAAKLEAEQDVLFDVIPNEWIEPIASGSGDDWLVRVTPNYGRECSRKQAIRIALGLDPMPVPPEWLTREWLKKTKAETERARAVREDLAIAPEWGDA